MATDRLSLVFGALADPTRRAILARLADGEATVAELAAPFSMSQPAVSKHLSALRKAGVVTSVKRGQHRMYRLDAEGLKPVHDWVKGFERFWTHQVDQIKRRAERTALERMVSVAAEPVEKEE